MKAHYESKKNLAMYAELNPRPTEQELDAFKQEYPEQGQIFDRCKQQTQFRSRFFLFFKKKH